MTRPSGVGEEVENRPCSSAWNGVAGNERCCARTVDVVVDTGAASRRAGVPARRAQPGGERASGRPDGDRRRGRRARPARRRRADGRRPLARLDDPPEHGEHDGAAETSASRSNQPARASLPVPNACTSATGQDA